MSHPVRSEGAAARVRRLVCVACALALAAVPARAFELTVPNNSTVYAEVTADDAEHVYLLRAPEDAKLSVVLTLDGGRGAPPPDLALVAEDADGNQLANGSRKGKRVRLKGLAVPAGAALRLVVTAQGDAYGPYRVRTRWKTVTRLRRDLLLDDEGATAAFATDAGSAVDVSISAARGSGALPRVLAITDATDEFAADGFEAPQDGSRKHNVKRVALGDALSYAVRFGNDGAPGEVRTKIRLRPPKAPRTNIPFLPENQAGEAESPPTASLAALIGATGGTIRDADPESAGNGAAIIVPPGALPAAVPIVVGLARTPIETPDGVLLPVGPTIQFGPAGLQFDAPVTIVIPFDASGLEENLDDVVVYRREGDGTVDVVPGPYVFDLVAGTVSFQTSSFTSFRVFAPPLFLTATDPRGLAPDDGAGDDEFGLAVAIEGDTAVVGAPGHDAKASNAGAVYVFVRESGVWQLQQKLLPDDLTAGARFGAHVAIDGETIAVGAPAQGNGAFVTGAVFVFTRSGTTWSPQGGKLIGSGVSNGGQMGASVALEGDVLVAGATGENATGVFGLQGSGATYVFGRSAGVWTQSQRLIEDSPTFGQQFGFALALEGSRLVIGAPGPSAEGTAFVFEAVGGTWSQTAELAPDDRTNEDQFGTSVALSGDLVAVGDPLHDDPELNVGRAYVFRRSGSAWPLEQALDAPLARRLENFGAEVAFSGARLAISSPTGRGTGVSANSSGLVYVFERLGGTWTSSLEVTLETPVANDVLGKGLAYEGSDLVAGAPASNTAGAGSAVVLRIVRTSQQ